MARDRSRFCKGSQPIRFLISFIYTKSYAWFVKLGGFTCATTITLSFDDKCIMCLLFKQKVFWFSYLVHLPKLSKGPQPRARSRVVRARSQDPRCVLWKAGVRGETLLKLLRYSKVLTTYLQIVFSYYLHMTERGIICTRFVTSIVNQIYENFPLETELQTIGTHYLHT